VRLLPWGSSPSSRRRPAASCNGLPESTAVHPRRFSRPRWFAPPPALWVYFTPLPRPGFSLQGFAPHTQPAHLVGESCPRVVGAELLPTVARQRHSSSPRPQGFAPGVDPLLARRRLAIARARSPPGTSLLQVLSLVAVGAPSRPTPLMAFRKKPSQSFSSLTCSVSPTTSLACLSRGCRPARGSSPAVPP